jgi:hypothetical protein
VWLHSCECTASGSYDGTSKREMSQPAVSPVAELIAKNTRIDLYHSLNAQPGKQTFRRYYLFPSSR